MYSSVKVAYSCALESAVRRRVALAPLDIGWLDIWYFDLRGTQPFLYLYPPPDSLMRPFWVQCGEEVYNFNGVSRYLFAFCFAPLHSNVIKGIVRLLMFVFMFIFPYTYAFGFLRKCTKCSYLQACCLIEYF